MQQSENQSRQQHAARAAFPDNLRAPVDKALKHILLNETPRKTDRELPGNWAFGMPPEKIRSRPKDQPQSHTDQRDNDHRRCQQFQGAQEVVEAESQVPKPFF